MKNSRANSPRRQSYRGPMVTVLGSAVRLTNGGDSRDTHDMRTYYY